MKGFIYLIEIAVAAIIMTVILSVFFSVRIKQGWERGEIISVGSNVLNAIEGKKDFFFNILDSDFSGINATMPANIKYGLRIIGSPKSNILIGCYQNCLYLDAIMNPLPTMGTIYLNGRWINFTVDSFDINAGIPKYDAIVLINYTNYSDPSINASLMSYLSSGGVLIAINATVSSVNSDFNKLFNLTSVSDSNTTVNFSYYNSTDDIEKYFMGIGLDAYQNWTIWEQPWRVDYWNGNRINITNIANPIDNRTNLVEGSVFNLTNPVNGIKYFFKVKKMWFPQRVDFQAMNKTFVFMEFSEKNVTGMNGLENIVGYGNHAAMTINNSAIWMSNFQNSSEYSSLLKAAVLSRLDDWTAKYSITSKETYSVSSFTSLCCDMPEIAELYLTMWYEI
jgi:hypothetical protein